MNEDAPAGVSNDKTPFRHPLGQDKEVFWNKDALHKEMERQFDICHTCRRCLSLCDSFPTLFDLVDESPTLELDGVDKRDFWKVVDQCYLCDLCFMTKCPYTPPHEFDMDFPHLMLRAKAVRHKEQGASLRDKVLAATDTLGKLAGIPVVAQAVNVANRTPATRVMLEKTLGVHRDARLPRYESRSARRRLAGHKPLSEVPMVSGKTRGKVAIFTTCYGEHNSPALIEDMVAVFEHNGIPTQLVPDERCCGMPRMEMGDIEAITKLKDYNIPRLDALAGDGWDIVAPIPSCVLMYKQELPMMFPQDEAVARVKAAFFDPFEYLMQRREEGLLNIGFSKGLGKVVLHASCHQRVQNIGPKTRDLLRLIPDTEVEVIERCSGHDGTYAVKLETYAKAMKIGRPVFRKVNDCKPDCYGSDCPLAGEQLEHGTEGAHGSVTHPISMLRSAYGI